MAFATKFIRTYFNLVSSVYKILLLTSIVFYQINLTPFSIDYLFNNEFINLKVLFKSNVFGINLN